MSKLAVRLAVLASLALTGCGVTGSPGAAQHDGALAARAIKNPTVLQKHVMFFDANEDGRLTVDETKRGLKRLGLGATTSLGGAVFIHAGLRNTPGGMDIDISKIHQGKHRSDTGAIDAEGRFAPAAFERMFSFDANHSGSLSWSELKAMIAANKQDGAGNLASKGEFGLLIKVAADTTETEGKERVPALSRARLQSFYTGNLFSELAAERERTPKAELSGPLPE